MSDVTQACTYCPHCGREHDDGIGERRICQCWNDE
jgi:hypothetical protein